MERRAFLGTLTGGLLAAPLAAEAQQPKPPWRVSIFNAGIRLPESVAGPDFFREELRSRGYVQGQNVVYEELWAEGHPERLPDLAADLVRLNMDVIVAVGTAQALAAKKATTTIPIVVVLATLPVEMGLVASLIRPGGNVTGTTLDAGTLENSKRLQLFQEVLPHGLPTAVIFSSSFPGTRVYLEQVLEAARQLHMTAEPIDVPTRDDDVVSLIGARRVGGLLVALDPVVAAQGQRIIEVASQKRWPTIFVGPLARRFVERGGLMCYGANVLVAGLEEGLV